MTGITRLNGKAETGASSNLTGVKSMFFSGYQPLFVKVSFPQSAYDLTSSYNTVNSEFEQVIRACEVVGSVVGYGIPANATNSSTVMVIFDGASVNQGDGVAGSGVTTGFGALKNALADASGVAAGGFSVTSYTGFTGASLS